MVSLTTSVNEVPHFHRSLLPSVNAFHHFHPMSRIQSGVNNDALLLFLSLFRSIGCSKRGARNSFAARILRARVSSCLWMRPEGWPRCPNGGGGSRNTSRNEHTARPGHRMSKGWLVRNHCAVAQHLLTFYAGVSRLCFCFRRSRREKNRGRKSQFISAYILWLWS